MKKESTAYKVVLLGVLCAVCGLILSAVNAMTAPVIEAAALAQVQASLEEIYPGGTFEAYDGFEDETGTIQDAYIAEGEGMIFKLKVVGYNADGFTFLVAFNNDGTVGGFIPLEQNETAGFGQRCFEDDYIQGVLGLTSNDSPDLLSGATLTSAAIQEGFDAARTVFNNANGIETKETVKKEPKAKVVTMSLNDEFEDHAVKIEEVSNDGKVAVYDCTAKGFGLIDPDGMATASGHEYERNEATITINLETMTVESIDVTSFGDTAGFGDKATKPEVLSTYEGKGVDDEIDAVSQATYTSKSIASMVHAALVAANEGGAAE